MQELIIRIVKWAGDMEFTLKECFEAIGVKGLTHISTIDRALFYMQKEGILLQYYVDRKKHYKVMYNPSSVFGNNGDIVAQEVVKLVIKYSAYVQKYNKLMEDHNKEIIASDEKNVVIEDLKKELEVSRQMIRDIILVNTEAEDKQNKLKEII